ncbi:MAG: DUF3592 domain-containing protein [Thermoanaerobaculia bacterium]
MNPQSSRRNQSSPVGCLVAFFGLFFLVGLAVFYFVTVRPVMLYVASRTWQEATCTVLSSQVGIHSGSDSTTYSVDVGYSYTFEGRDFQAHRYGFLGGSSSGRAGKEEIVARYPPGAHVSCWIDPAHPEQAVLNREPSAEWLVGLIPLVFLLVGGGGIWGVLRGRQRSNAAAYALPTEPEPIRGPLELKPGATPWAKLFAVTFVTLFWNGIVSVFVVQAVKLWRTGSPDGCLTLFLVPFVAIGLFLIYATLRQLLVLFNPRLHLTLTPGTLVAGESAFLQWRFGSGGGGVRRLTLVLEGWEETQSGQGKNVHTEKAVFATVPVLETRQELEIPSGSTSFTVPADARPSAVGSPRIRWALKAHCDIAGWPDSDDEYEVRVMPRDAARGSIS